MISKRITRQGTPFIYRSPLQVGSLLKTGIPSNVDAYLLPLVFNRFWQECKLSTGLPPLEIILWIAVRMVPYFSIQLFRYGLVPNVGLTPIENITQRLGG